MASEKQVKAAKRNVKRAQPAAQRERTIADRSKMGKSDLIRAIRAAS